MRIKVNLAKSGSLAGFNDVFTATTTGVKVADLEDENGVATGYALNLLVAFTDSLEIASADPRPDSTPDPDFPTTFFRQAWYIGSSYSEPLSITGLPAGSPYSISLAGYNAGPDRDTTYTVTGGEGPATYITYSEGDTNTPNPPVVITGTVPANGTLTISLDGVQTFGYLNGFMLDINPNVPTISETFVADDKDTFLPGTGQVRYSIHHPTTHALVAGPTEIAVTDGEFVVSNAALEFATEYLVLAVRTDRSRGRPFYATTNADPAV